MISKEMILNGDIKWKFEEIDRAQESYWKHSEVDHGMEEYCFEDVTELESRIAEMTGVCLETTKRLALEAFKRYYGSSCQKREQENRESTLPDFVYML